MPLRLMRAEKSDISQLVDLYFSTFKSPLVLRLKPNIPPVREWYRQRLKIDIDKPHIRIYKVMEAQDELVRPSDEIVAFAQWSSPHTEPPQENLTKFPTDGDATLFEEVISKVLEKRMKIMGEEAHWCKLLTTQSVVRQY